MKLSETEFTVSGFESLNMLMRLQGIASPILLGDEISQKTLNFIRFFFFLQFFCPVGLLNKREIIPKSSQLFRDFEGDSTIMTFLTAFLIFVHIAIDKHRSHPSSKKCLLETDEDLNRKL